MKYMAGPQVQLGDRVEMDIGEISLLGTVVYAEGLGSLQNDFVWCKAQKLKGVIVRWEAPDKAKRIFNGDADFIQIAESDTVELTFIARA